jgi:hypothetical protein
MIALAGRSCENVASHAVHGAGPSFWQGIFGGVVVMVDVAV